MYEGFKFANLLKLTDIVCDGEQTSRSAVLSVSAMKDIQKCSPFNKMKQTVTKSEVIIQRVKQAWKLAVIHAITFLRSHVQDAN